MMSGGGPTAAAYTVTVLGRKGGAPGFALSFGLAVCVPGAACTAPGTEQVVDPARCARTPETPPAAAVPLPASAVHRLVVSLSNATMRAWLDRRPTAPVQTRLTDAGPAEFCLTTDDCAAQSFRVVRAAMCAPATAGS